MDASFSIFLARALGEISLAFVQAMIILFCLILFESHWSYDIFTPYPNDDALAQPDWNFTSCCWPVCFHP